MAGALIHFDPAQKRLLSRRPDRLATSSGELDWRPIRLEAQFELLKRMASPSRRALPEKSET